MFNWRMVVNGVEIVVDAEAFRIATGMYPSRKEVGDWVFQIGQCQEIIAARFDRAADRAMRIAAAWGERIVEVVGVL